MVLLDSLLSSKISLKSKSCLEASLLDMFESFRMPSWLASGGDGPVLALCILGYSCTLERIGVVKLTEDTVRQGQLAPQEEGEADERGDMSYVGDVEERSSK